LLLLARTLALEKAFQLAQWLVLLRALFVVHALALVALAQVLLEAVVYLSAG
jgi:hypothetical protein